MKKYFLLFLIIGAGITNINAQNNANQIQLASVEITHQEKGTWQEFDKLYEGFANDKSMQSNKCFDKMKQDCISSIVEDTDFTKDKSPEAQKKALFYLSEIQKSDFINPVILVKLLNMSSISDKTKKEYASNALFKSENAYKEHISNFENNECQRKLMGDYLEKFKNSVEQLEKLKSL